MKLITLLIYVCFALNVSAQQKDSVTIKKRNNTLSLNVGGEGFYFGTTLAFEKSLLNTKYLHLGLGVAAGKTYGLYYDRICLPTYLNFKMGKKRHFVELNIGVNHLIDLNPYPNTKAERDEFKKNPRFNTYSVRLPYIPSYFATINYVFKAYNGFLLKIGCTGSKTKLDFGYPSGYFILPRLSLGYAF